MRFALMFEPPIPRFEPSPESQDLARDVRRTEVEPVLSALGVNDLQTMRLFLAINAGIVSQQNATNPGGNEWRPLMDRAVDMFLEHIGSSA